MLRHLDEVIFLLLSQPSALVTRQSEVDEGTSLQLPHREQEEVLIDALVTSAKVDPAS
jgi:hypothetical protein